LYLSEKKQRLWHLQHKLIGFYNRDEKCLLRGTNWGFRTNWRKTAQKLMLAAICRRQVVCVVGAAEFTLVPLRTELPHFLIRQKYDYLESLFEYNSLACVVSKHKTGRTISVQALRVSGVQAPTFQEIRHSEVSKVVSPTQQPSYSLIYVRG
jgi:hypothetical protein